MNPLAEEFERQVWATPPNDPAGWVSAFLQRLADARMALPALLEEQSDETLALALQRNICVREAIVELLENRYHRRLWWWFQEYGADAHTAFDLVHELFLRVYAPAEGRTRFAGYDPNQSFDTFLRTVARNLCISRVHRPRRPDLVGNKLERSGPDETAETVAYGETARRVAAAVEALPEPDRSVMRLTMQEHTPSEIAAELGIPVSRVYQVRHRARQALLVVLEPTLPPNRRGRPLKKPTDHRPGTEA